MFLYRSGMQSCLYVILRLLSLLRGRSYFEKVLSNTCADFINQAQRDLSQQVPINYVTQPGIFLTAACFGHNRYDEAAAQTCISNLLAVGFRRLVVDVYWDRERGEWSLCPISGTGSEPVTTSSSTAGPSTASFTPTATSTQMTQTTSSVSVSNASQPASSAGAQLAEDSDHQLGPYTCTPALNLAFMTALLLDYLQMTQNTLEAHLLYLTLNIHAAGSASSPVPPAEVLPAPSISLATLFREELSNLLYTPSMLNTDRTDLNSSWYSVPAVQQPLASYYTTNVDRDSFYSTPDGWPSESYVQNSQGIRLLVGLGSIDPQMRDYDTTDDQEFIFQPGDLESIPKLRATSSGDVIDGCKPDLKIDSFLSLNASWAISGDIADFDYPEAQEAPLEPLLNLTSNLASCGISPILNTTIQNATADTNISVYQNIPYSAIWSWASGEPRNSSNGSSFRCAALDPSLNGEWHVDDCSGHKNVACRSDRPFDWRLSKSPVPFTSADSACPEGTRFDVPRTGIENRYLLAAAADRSDRDERSVWLNLNSIEVEACWVTGVNATCPYYQSDVEIQRRAVLVPSIGALIVLVITALTLFVKCNSNRRNSKRKRRGEGGWDYEG